LCSTDDIRNWEMTIGSLSVSYKPVILFVSFEYVSQSSPMVIVDI